MYSLKINSYTNNIQSRLSMLWLLKKGRGDLIVFILAYIDNERMVHRSLIDPYSSNKYKWLLRFRCVELDRMFEGWYKHIKVKKRWNDLNSSNTFKIHYFRCFNQNIECNYCMSEPLWKSINKKSSIINILYAQYFFPIY